MDVRVVLDDLSEILAGPRAVPFRPSYLTLNNLQDCEDDSGDDMKRERSMLLLATLASDALDGVSGVSKVCVIGPLLAVFSRKHSTYCQSLASSCQCLDWFVPKDG